MIKVDILKPREEVVDMGKYYKPVNTKLINCVDGRDPIASIEELQDFRIHKGKILETNCVKLNGGVDVPDHVVDHRLCADHTVMAQALGGIVEPALLKTILAGQNLNIRETFPEAFKTLRNAGAEVCVHQGPHGSKENCDCGFCQNLPRIVEVMLESRNAYYDLFAGLFGEEIADVKTWKTVIKQTEKFFKTSASIPRGNKILDMAVDADGKLIVLRGSHAEISANVNFIPDTSFDTNLAVAAGHSAFNRDAYAVQKHTDILGLTTYDDRKRVLLLGHGLYAATKQVLVVEKGKSDLPLFMNGTVADIQKMLEARSFAN